MEQITCFISYSWESESHKNWTRKLAKYLQEKGIYVHLDQWDVRPGADIPHYMETSVRESNFVLLICTPTFAKKADLGEGGVGYEKSVVTGEIFTKAVPNIKFVPILRDGNESNALPSYLKSKMYIDFRDENFFENSVEHLLRHLYDNPKFERPPLGSPPQFDTKSIHVESSTANTKKIRLNDFKELVNYAYSRDGLNYSKDDAVAWATSNKGLDLKHFKELVNYAYSRDGLNYSKDDAVAWALNQA